MKAIRKVFNCEVKDINDKEKTLTAFVSTAAVDRMGDILEPKGADVKNFNKNPVVMWAHDYALPPIAKALWIKKTQDGIVSKMKFADTEFAQEIFNLYKEDFMKAFSVGFIPKESEPVNPEKDGFFDGRRFTKWEMLEYSAVPIPANPEALTMAVTKGVITEDRKACLEEMQKAIEDAKKAEIKYYDVYGNEVELPELTTTTMPLSVEEVTKWIKENGELIDDETLNLLEVKKEVKGLEDLVAENELLTEQITALEKEISGLRYSLYVAGSKTQKAEPGITVDNLAENFVSVMNGVIRETQGKID